MMHNRHFDFFSFSPQKTGFDNLCKLFPEEAICMKRQCRFPGKICWRLQNLPIEW